MRVVYSDESGCGENESEPLALVTAILLNMENQWDPVRKDLAGIRAIMPRGLLDNKHPLSHEIKGSLLFKGLRNKVNRVKPSVAAKFLRDILLLVPKHSIFVFHGAIDRAGRKNFIRNAGLSKFPELEQEAAFRECLGHLEDFVRGFLPKEKVLWVADHGGYETAIKDGLRFHRTLQVLDLSEYLQGNYADTEDERGLASWGRRIKYTDDPETASPILDTIYFGHSHESLALQLADVCCSVITQYLLGQQDGTDLYQLILHLNHIVRGPRAVKVVTWWSISASRHSNCLSSLSPFLVNEIATCTTGGGRARQTGARLDAEFSEGLRIGCLESQKRNLS